MMSFFFNKKTCSHAMKGGALRWLYHNAAGFKEGSIVKRKCGGCGSELTFAIGKFAKQNKYKIYTS